MMPDENKPIEDSENQPKEEKDTDIPLWLQGLEHSEEQGENIDPEPSESIQSQWVKELDDNPQPEGLDFTDLEELTPKSDLPDWMDHLGNDFSEDADTLESLDQDQVAQPTAEEPDKALQVSVEDVSLEMEDQETTSPEFAEIVDELVNGTPDDKGFIEISEIEEDLDPVQELTDLEESVSDDEELPEWLQEMINEPDQVKLPPVEVDSFALEQTDLASEIEELPDSLADEPTQPVTIAKAEDAVENLPQPESEPSDESSPQDEGWIQEVDLVDVDEEETVAIQEVEAEEGEESPVVAPEAEISDAGLPEELLEAQTLLENGQISDAAHLFTHHATNPDYNHQIQAWLINAAECEAQGNSEIWETLGDLKLNDDDPQGALEAYNKAIQVFLDRKRADHDAQ